MTLWTEHGISSVFGLKDNPHTAIFLPLRFFTPAAIFSANNFFCFSLPAYRVHHGSGEPQFFGGRGQLLNVFGKTAAAVAGSGVNIVAANAVVRAQGLPDQLNVSAARFAKLGQLVNQGNAEAIRVLAPYLVISEEANP